MTAAALLIALACGCVALATAEDMGRLRARAAWHNAPEPRLLVHRGLCAFWLAIGALVARFLPVAGG